MAKFYKMSQLPYVILLVFSYMYIYVSIVPNFRLIATIYFFPIRDPEMHTLLMSTNSYNKQEIIKSIDGTNMNTPSSYPFGSRRSLSFMQHSSMTPSSNPSGSRRSLPSIQHLFNDTVF